jgi:WhiB family redox-sensing transcriptional regulator
LFTDAAEYDLTDERDGILIATEILTGAGVELERAKIKILAQFLRDPDDWFGRNEVLGNDEWRRLLSALAGSNNDDVLGSQFVDVSMRLSSVGVLGVRTQRKENGKIISGTQFCLSAAKGKKPDADEGSNGFAGDDNKKNWQDEANCLGVDPDLFFPERGASTREAKEVCRGCIVRQECLEYALSNGEKFGIWGALSERERRRLRRQRALAAHKVQA